MTTTTTQTQVTTADMAAAVTTLSAELIELGLSPVPGIQVTAYGGLDIEVTVHLNNPDQFLLARAELPGFGKMEASGTSVSLTAERQVGGLSVRVRIWIAAERLAEKIGAEAIYGRDAVHTCSACGKAHRNTPGSAQ